MAKCPVSGHVDVLITCMYVKGVEVGVQMSCIIPFNPLICLALGTGQCLKKNTLYIIIFMVSSLLCIFSCATGCYDQKPELLCKYNMNGWYPPPPHFPSPHPFYQSCPQLHLLAWLRLKCVCVIYILIVLVVSEGKRQCISTVCMGESCSV